MKNFHELAEMFHDYEVQIQRATGFFDERAITHIFVNRNDWMNALMHESSPAFMGTSVQHESVFRITYRGVPVSLVDDPIKPMFVVNPLIFSRM